MNYKEIKRFRKNLCNFGVIFGVLSWMIAVFYDFGVYALGNLEKRSSSLVIDSDLNIAKDLFEGAFGPIFMILDGNIIGLLIVIAIFLGFCAFSINKKSGSIIFILACSLSNFAAYGLMIKPVYMIATLAAPAIFVVCCAFTMIGVVSSEIKRTLRYFIGSGTS